LTDTVTAIEKNGEIGLGIYMLIISMAICDVGYENEKNSGTNLRSFGYVWALIMGWIERKINKKERGAFPKLTTTFSPLLIIASRSLFEEHAGRLERDNSNLVYTFDTPNTSSWFSSQPKDNP
jgi:hypothetical protein